MLICINCKYPFLVEYVHVLTASGPPYRQMTVGGSLTCSRTLSYDVAPVSQHLRARGGTRNAPGTWPDLDLCKEPMTWLFTHVISYVQSQLITCRQGNAGYRLSSPHTDSV
ncbi:hypothetical protein AB205_0015730 [Aquarana catesbeiana]|uniref:Uncharacterized protein n=1 Tax=Aquarana catesbeiana TaxID=8400 RepID=A0A2G9S8F2_AQUCT|nr:hypothetical protein AB205_0015730 [Aquarana catesbeiana]